MMLNYQEKISEEYSFAHKWSPDILAHGFTAVPNLLFSQRRKLRLTAPELFVLIAIESYRWDTKDPWPSLSTLSNRTGYSTRNLSRVITSLVKKGLLKRTSRRGTSNMYSLQPLIKKLDKVAKSVQPKGKSSHYTLDKNNAEAMTTLSPKQYAAKNTQLLKPINKTSAIENSAVESVSEIIKRRF